VFSDEADEGDEADLRVDVDRGEAEEEEHQCAGQGERDGEHDDERIAPAFVLGGQDEEDDDDREGEGGDQRAALLDVLADLALVVGGEAFREDLPGFVVEPGEGVAEGDAGARDEADGGAVELLESGEVARRDRRLDGRDRGERDEFP